MEILPLPLLYTEDPNNTFNLRYSEHFTNRVRDRVLFVRVCTFECSNRRNKVVTSQIVRGE